MSINQNLIRLRAGEMKNFQEALLTTQVREYSREAEFFKSLVALAITDYQVAAADLAASLGLDESEVMGWGKDDAEPSTLPSQEVREQVIALIAADLATKLESV